MNVTSAELLATSKLGRLAPPDPDLHEALGEAVLLAAIVQDSDDAIYGLTPDGIVTAWNGGAERLFGWTADEMIDQPVGRLYLERDRDEYVGVMRRLAQGGRIVQWETVRRHKDGRPLDVSLTMSPLRGRSGRVLGISTVARDISRQKIEERYRDAFVAAVSHELRTPLTVFNLGVQAAKRAFVRGQSERVVEHLEAAERDARRLARMLDDVLQVVTTEQSEARPALREPVALVPLVTAAALAEQLVAGRVVDLHAAPCPDVVGEAAKLERVVANLVNNALKYSPPDAPVAVSLRQVGQEAEVRVADRGPGVPPQRREAIFSPFARANGEAHVKGLGLGLFLARRIAQQHGGSLTLEEPDPEQPGATFVLRLPLP